MKVLAASAVGLGLAAMTSAQAMPLAPLGQTTSDDEAIIRVADGCGPGWHTGPFGRRCFRNW